MYQLTQLADDQHRQRLAAAEAQRPAQRALALARATRRAERAERRLRRAERAARRLRAQLQPRPPTTSDRPPAPAGGRNPQRPSGGHHEPHPLLPSRPPPGRHPGRTGHHLAGRRRRGPGRVRPARASRGRRRRDAAAPGADRHRRRHARLADRPDRRDRRGRWPPRWRCSWTGPGPPAGTSPPPAPDPPTDPAPSREAPATDTIPVQLPVACPEGAQPPRRGRPALTTQPGEGTAGAPRTPSLWIPGGPARVVHTPGRCQQQNQPAYQANHRQRPSAPGTAHDRSQTTRHTPSEANHDALTPPARN